MANIKLRVLSDTGAVSAAAPPTKWKVSLSLTNLWREEKVWDHSLSSHMQIRVVGMKGSVPLGKARSKDRQEIGSGLSPTLLQKHQGAEPAQRVFWDTSWQLQSLTLAGQEAGEFSQGFSTGGLEMLSTLLCCWLRAWSYTKLPGHRPEVAHGQSHS